MIFLDEKIACWIFFINFAIRNIISSMITGIPILYMLFDHGIQPEEVPSFRRVMVRYMNNDTNPKADVCKKGESESQYPLAQYKILCGRPVIVALGNAIPRVDSLLSRSSFSSLLGVRKVDMKIEKVECHQYQPRIQASPRHYSMNHYVFSDHDSGNGEGALLPLKDQTHYIEGLLKKDILTFFKSIGYHGEKELKIIITDKVFPERINYKGEIVQVLDFHFISNILLPDGIGLGKHSDIGFGTIIMDLSTKPYQSAI